MYDKYKVLIYIILLILTIFVCLNYKRIYEFLKEDFQKEHNLTIYTNSKNMLISSKEEK